MTEKIKGQTVVISTTNGTQAIEAAKHAYKVVIGSFLNIDALCNWLITENKSVLLLCSGWKNKFNLEDTLYAGAVTEILGKTNQFNLGDGALATKYLYQQAHQNPYKFLSKSSHKIRLSAMGLKEDIKYCLALNKTKIIPILHHGVLVAM